MTLIGQQYGIGGISGAVIAAGIFTLLCAPFVCKLVRFFPKAVMGTIVTLIGLSILPVAGGWIGGGDLDAVSFWQLRLAVDGLIYAGHRDANLHLR
ncbi:Putative purine permease ygfU [Hafnia alvei]|uniref:Purine permease ygfU n=1 Tax=Hafnia alvei TaxID=569 RepID=A0A377PIJ3_HAFAL|nr:Putative purine permease ygfU [Hafnia alvei]